MPDTGAALTSSLRPSGAGVELDEFLRSVMPEIAARILRWNGVPQDRGEDLIQIAAVITWRRWEELEDPEGFFARVLHNQCIVFWRDRRRYESRFFELPEQDQSAAPEQAIRELSRDLRELGKALGARDYLVVWLRYGQGWGWNDVADYAELSRESVRQIGKRALARLSRLWKDKARPLECGRDRPRHPKPEDGRRRSGELVLDPRVVEERGLVRALLADLSQLTVRTYSDTLRAFGRWWGVRAEGEVLEKLLAAGAEEASAQLRAFRDHLLTTGNAANTINVRLSALRSLLVRARRSGWIDWEVELASIEPRPRRSSQPGA